MEKDSKWAVYVSSAAQYAALVRLIAANGWPCSAALKEEGAYEYPEQVFWNGEKGMLWRGRCRVTEIAIGELPGQMKL